MTILSAEEVVIYNTDDLRDAVSSASSFKYLYLGSDIVLQYGVTIDPNKQSLVFDGLHEGIRHSFTDMDSNLDLNTLGIRTTSNIAMTFKNMDMTGRNYYGIPFVVGDAAFINNKNVSVTYENITYTGPQLTYNPDGLARYIDCDITISPFGGTPAQEVGEINRVEMDGVNTIRHNSTTDAVFWFRGHTAQAYFKMLPGASAAITTTNYFMYSVYYVLGIPVQNPAIFEIQPGAGLTLTTHRGFSDTANHRAVSFLVDTGASFRYVQEASNGANASLYVNENFTVNEGARVYMQADFDGAQPLINFPTGTVPLQLAVNNPKSFVLYDKASAPVALTSPATRNFLLGGGQINYWNAARPFPDAGGWGDIPKDKWYKRPDWSYFSLTGNVTSAQTRVTGTSLTPEEQSGLPSINELVFGSARVLSVGDLPLEPDPALDNGRPITGLTEPGAKVAVTYTAGGQDYAFAVTAGTDGLFSVDTAMSIPVGTVVTVKANLPFLITEKKITVVAAGDIILESAPDRIAFGLPPISASPLFLRRRNPEEPVVVNDTRQAGTRWELLASIAGPLKTAAGEILEGTVVFKSDAGVVTELSGQPIVVYTGGPGAGITQVFWPVEKGILVRVTGPIRSSVEYSTQLQWELRTI